MNHKKTILLAVLLVCAQALCWPQQFYTETSHAWINKDTVPVYFRAAGQADGLIVGNMGSTNTLEASIVFYDVPEGA